VLAIQMSRKGPPSDKMQIIRESAKEKNSLAKFPRMDRDSRSLSSLAPPSTTSIGGPIRNDVVADCIHCRKFPEGEAGIRFDKVGFCSAAARFPRVRSKIPGMCITSQSTRRTRTTRSRSAICH
jgi:hypothetical protein